MVRPLTTQLSAVDLALAPGDRLGTACSFVGGTLNSTAALSIASRSSAASTSPTQVCLAAIFVNGPGDWLRFRFLRHAASIGRKVSTFNGRGAALTHTNA